MTIQNSFEGLTDGIFVLLVSGSRPELFDKSTAHRLIAYRASLELKLEELMTLRDADALTAHKLGLLSD